MEIDWAIMVVMPPMMVIVSVFTLHHNTKISDGRSDAKSSYSDRQSDAKKL